MKRLLVLSVGLLASASIFGEAATVPVPTVKPVVKEEPKEPVVAAPVIKIPEKRECKAHAPYSDIASVMQDEGVLDVVKVVSPEVAQKIRQIGEIIRRAEKLDIDFCNFTDTGKTFMSRLSCVKAGKVTRQGPRAVVCAPYGCGGSKSDCLKKSLQSLRTMLQMLFEDLFIGYQDGNTKVEGMALLLLNLGDSKAESIRNELKSKVLPVLEKIINVLGVVEKLIPADK